MTDRMEIPKRVKLEVLVRAGGPADPRCEGTDGKPCGLSLRGKPMEYEHVFPEWLHTTPKKDRPPITAKDVRLNGHCCHKPKTAREAKERAKDYAVLEKHNGIRPKRKGKPMPGTKASGWKHKMSGDWVRR